MKMKKWLLIGGTVLVVVIIGLMLSNGQEVEVIRAQEGILVKQIQDSGYVQEADDYKIQAAQQAKVLTVSVETGEEVEEGQEVLLLENRDLAAQMDSVSAQIAQVKAELNAGTNGLEITRMDLEQAEKDLQRQKKLMESGAVSSADYEQAVLAADKFRKTVSQQSSYVNDLNLQLSNMENMYSTLEEKNQELVVLSPAQGRILDLPVEKGQVVYPGTLLVQIGTGELEIKADILSDDLREVKPEQKVLITAPVLGDLVIEGQVKKIYPRAYEKTSALGVVQRRVPVIISLNNPEKLRPGYEVRVSIQTMEKADILVLPREAVRSDGKGGYEVMAVANGRVQYREVTMGARNAEKAEITEGLKAGDMVIRDAGMDIAEKAKVKAIEYTE